MTPTTDDHDAPAELSANQAYVRRVHDRGLAFDLGTMNRRRMLGLAGAGALAVATVPLFSGTASAAECVAEVNSETAGPYPADGSNGVDVRTENGIVRADLRSSFGDSTTTVDGVPLSIELVLNDPDCKPISGAAVYLWHCDTEGNYSLYSDGITDENYLRGIQETDDAGTVRFTSIFPACYAGRWPHIHFEVYSSLAHATSGDGPIVKTSQIALPAEVCRTVFADSRYTASTQNLSQVSLESDNVFGDDDGVNQVATVTGDNTAGWVSTLTITVNPDEEESGGGSAPEGGGGPGGEPSSGGPGGPAPGNETSSNKTSSSQTSSSETSRNWWQKLWDWVSG